MTDIEPLDSFLEQYIANGISEMTKLRDALVKQERWLNHAGRINGKGNWWDIQGVRSILDDCIERIAKHRERAERV